MIHALDLKPDEKEALTRRALAQVSQNFSLEAMCDAILAVYKTLLTKPS